ncbi:MAG TPA: zinc metalloprotease HtpX [Acidimicrobiia bacterium]|nr:zinc metalloprotease HtpX [Acidimicrobiia bacterium]
MYEQIAANKRKSVLLIALFVLLLTAVGIAFDFFLRGGAIGLVVVAVIVIVSSFVSYFNSDKVALRMAHAQPADPVEYARFHNLVEGLCIASGLPKPRLYIVDDPAPNAFSTGRNPKHAAVAVTTGLLDRMNRVELEGVLAHELSHIRNYDVLVMTLAVTMVGIIVLLSDFFLRIMFWTGGRGGRDNESNNPLGIVFAIVGFILLIFAPIIAALMQMAVSRRREFLADASGVQLTRYPPGLISALEKLKDDHTATHFASKATAHLWIEEPLDKESNKGDTKWNHLFDTHPPIDDRIHALEQM